MPATIKRQATSKELVLDPAARLRQLSDHGSSVQVDRTIPIKRYFRSGSEMERQARVYYTEGQWDRAFMLYNKFATLFIEKLPKHPEYAKAPATDKSRIKKLLKQALPRAMELKEKLKERYSKEKEQLEKTIQEEEAAKREEEERRLEEERKRAEERARKEDQSKEIEAFFSGQGGVVTTSSTTEVEVQSTEVTGGEYPPAQQTPPTLSEQTLSEQTSQATFSNEEATPTLNVSPDQPFEAAPPQMDTTQSNLTATDPALAQVLPSDDVPPPYNPAPTAPPPTAPPASFQQAPPTTYPYTLQQAPPPGQPGNFPPPATLQQAPPSTLQQAPPSTLQQAPPSTLQQAPPSYNQMVGMASTTGIHPLPPAQRAPPSIQGPGQLTPTLQQRTYENSLFQSPFASPPIGSSTVSPHPLATPPPGAPYTTTLPPAQGNAPGMVSGYQQQNWNQTQAQSPAHQPGPPVVDRSTKPDSLTNSLKALNTGATWGEGYRPVYVPADTATRFEEVASTNTRRNIETCGILAGKLSQNTLQITHIIMPKQKGKADSCETLSEEELFDVQDQYDLITLGWIHTHPSQTAFMSSVDLHCHCSYQIMMDEAVAIVVAPKFNEVGYFMLTEPHGLNYITHCEEEGFHVHPKEPPLYEECKHIHHDPSTFIQIVDLR